MALKIPVAGLIGPALNLKNWLEQYLGGLLSVPMAQVPDVASLPNPLPFKHRQIIVSDIDGMGTFGVATSDGTAWYDPSGSAL